MDGSGNLPLVNFYFFVLEFSLYFCSPQFSTNICVIGINGRLRPQYLTVVTGATTAAATSASVICYVMSKQIALPQHFFGAIICC